jgi:integrase
MSKGLATHEAATPTTRAAHQVVIPETIADEGDRAAHRFFEFFTANIRNPNTRRAYHRTALAFFAWSQVRGLALGAIEAAGIEADKKGPLFRSANRRTGQLAANPLSGIGCHTFRATGITVYLTDGGTLENAQQMAAHESAKTTKLYDRTNDAISLDEVERIVF